MYPGGATPRSLRNPRRQGLFGGPLSAFPSVRNQRRNTIQVARALDKGVYQLGAQA